MAKKGTITINGTDYTVQHPGAMWYLELRDRCRGPYGSVQEAPYSKEMIETVIKQPKVSVEDFEEDIAGLKILVNKIETFLGRRPNEGKSDSDGGEGVEADNE